VKPYTLTFSDGHDSWSFVVSAHNLMEAMMVFFNDFENIKFMACSEVKVEKLINE
jgi:hypothetical protein